jgi:hypothetical protein
MTRASLLCILLFITFSVNAQYFINGPYNTDPYKVYTCFIDNFSKEIISNNKVKNLWFKTCFFDKKGKSDTVTIWEIEFNKSGNPNIMKFYSYSMTVVINLFYDDHDRLSICKESERIDNDKTETSIIYFYNDQNRILKQVVSSTDSYQNRKKVTKSNTDFVFDFIYNDTTQKISICRSKIYDDNSMSVSQNYISCSYDSLFIEKNQKDISFDKNGNIIEVIDRNRHIDLGDSCGYFSPYTLKYYYDSENKLIHIDEYNCKNKLIKTTHYSYYSNGLLKNINDSDTKDFDLFLYEFNTN